jgi:ABC-type phosphate transport system substrate-binding protein
MRRRSSTGLIFSLLAIAILVSRVSAQNGDIAVIVNPNSSVTNVSLADLRKIFSGEKRSWPGGTRIKIIVRPPGSRERIVLLRLMGISESEYKQYWTAQVFRGDTDAEPVSLPSFGMVKEAAKTFPGAIGLTDARDIKPGMDLKILKVDGYLPGDPGYPLH